MIAIRFTADVTQIICSFYELHILSDQVLRHNGLFNAAEAFNVISTGVKETIMPQYLIAKDVKSVEGDTIWCNATSTHTPLCGGVNTASGRVQAPGSLTHARDGANIKCLNICRQFLWHYNSRPREGGELRNRSSKRYLNSRPRVGANVPHCNQSGAFGAATHAPPWSE